MNLDLLLRPAHETREVCLLRHEPQAIVTSHTYKVQSVLTDRTFRRHSKALQHMPQASAGGCGRVGNLCQEHPAPCRGYVGNVCRPFWQLGAAQPISIQEHAVEARIANPGHLNHKLRSNQKNSGCPCCFPLSYLLN